ncbi:hypothetical protein [Nocardioides sp.]|nr:hypothetical protein [Nocardioides sp.]
MRPHRSSINVTLAGLRERVQLELVDRREFRSGAVALSYRSR